MGNDIVGSCGCVVALSTPPDGRACAQIAPLHARAERAQLQDTGVHSRRAASEGAAAAAGRQQRPFL